MSNGVSYRPEINGLRAFSIALVLLYHLFPSYLKSGFIGVDIFFVISGYLIVQILLKGNSGQVSLVDFFKNRFLRLSPSLLAVLITTTFAGWFIFLPDEYLALAKATFSSFLLQSNFYEMSRSAYFESTVNSRPLLHLWSLAVEVQFYIFVAVLIKIFHKSKFILNILILIALISFTLNLCFIDKHSAAVFYLSPFRIWEILCGSITALIQGEKLVSKYYNYAGALLLLFSVAFINNQLQFPGAVALLPVMGASFLLLKAEKNLISKVLSLKPIVYIGVLSYSIYLWHWPILDISKLVYGSLSPIFRVLIVAVTLILAFITTKFIEEPIRKNKKIITAFMLSFLVLLGSLFIIYDSGIANRNVNLKNYILNKNNSLILDYRRSCNGFIQDVDKEDRCNADKYVKNKTDIVLIGDSQANAFTTVFEGMQKYKDFNFLQLGRGMCPALLGYGIPSCTKFSEQIFNYIAKEKSIKTVVLAAQWPLYSDGLNVNGGRFSSELFWQSLETTVREYQSSGKVVYLIYTVPLGSEPRRCFKRLPFITQSCDLKLDAVNQIESNYRIHFDKVVTATKVAVIDPKKALCDQDKCSVMVDSKIFYLDGSHLSKAGGEYLSDRLKDVLFNGLLNSVSLGKNSFEE